MDSLQNLESITAANHMIAPPTQRTAISQASVEKIAVRINATTRVISPAAVSPYTTLVFPVANCLTRPLSDLTTFWHSIGRKPGLVWENLLRRAL